jgi:hypothetical protein
MSSGKKDGAAIIGVGAAACVVCCAGPIIGFLAAIGLGTAAGFAVFGSIALIIGAAVVAVVVGRRRRRDTVWSRADITPTWRVNRDGGWSLGGRPRLQ